jgi:hypothetical protein
MNFARIPIYAPEEVNETEPDYALVHIPTLGNFFHDI